MGFIKRFIKPLFFGRLFYIAFAVMILLFVLSFNWPFLYAVASYGLLFFITLVLLDYIILFSRKGIHAERKMAERFSNGDENAVSIVVNNRYNFPVFLKVIDELPVQFQKRDFLLKLQLGIGRSETLHYKLRPVERGEYTFHHVNVFAKSILGLVIRRFQEAGEETTVRVLPSFFALRQFELRAMSNNLADAGSRKIRKIGHSLEFEQIKEYVTGDDIRSLNWKATARKGGQLMVNNYSDERSQQIYCVIDKGRVMKMPFEGMSLLDYAINATLVLTRVALLRQDKAGLVTFSDTLGQFLPADRRPGQMNLVLETLYNQQTQYLEPDYEKLYALVRTRITQRSLIVLFANFESVSGLQRQLPYIRSIARNHLLLVVFFENTELKQLTEQKVTNIESLYMRTIAERINHEKRLIVKELQQHGITTILTTPQNLTVETVNKYLELKARQAI